MSFVGFLDLFGVFEVSRVFSGFGLETSGEAFCQVDLAPKGACFE